MHTRRFGQKLKLPWQSNTQSCERWYRMSLRRKLLPHQKRFSLLTATAR